MNTKIRARHALVVAMLALAALPVAGCAVAPETEDDDHDHESEPSESSEEAISSLSCSASSSQGYTRGVPTPITVVRVDTKPVERRTANAYYVMAKAAEKDGVQIRVVSGFRTNSEQQYFYACYKNCNCNGCAEAARPGYSNHQSGHALDLNYRGPGVLAWLQKNGAKYGFYRTVPREDWHWEWWGGGPGGGPCNGGNPAGTKSEGGPAGVACSSQTLGRTVSHTTCVQSKADNKFYQCLSGGWVERTPAVSVPCAAEYPL